MMNFRAAATLGCSQRMKCSSGFRLPASLCPHMAGRRLRELWASLVAQMVKNLPAVRETRVQSLGREDPLEKEIATHSSILAWEIPCTEEAGRLQSMGSQRVECDCLTLSLLHSQVRGNTYTFTPDAFLFHDFYCSQTERILSHIFDFSFSCLLLLL